MKLGIKVSLRPETISNLEATGARHAEIWFNINEKARYDGLFSYLDAHKIEPNIHFWGTISGSILTNIAYPDRTIWEPSVAQILETIDSAAAHGCGYVNIHPGSRSKITIDLEKEAYLDISEPVALDAAQQTFLANAKALFAYAQKKGVCFTVETVIPRVPKSGWHKPESRLTPIAAYELPIGAIHAAASAGIWIANDFGHTVTQTTATDPTSIWQFLRRQTVSLATHTKLLHLGFVVPPYNGTDFHDSLDNPLFETHESIPNKKHMIELLRLFRGRDDVWALVEPRSDHVKNYFLAKTLIEQAAKI